MKCLYTLGFIIIYVGVGFYAACPPLLSTFFVRNVVYVESFILVNLNKGLF